jgi:hypothetical protein
VANNLSSSVPWIPVDCIADLKEIPIDPSLSCV